MKNFMRITLVTLLAVQVSVAALAAGEDHKLTLQDAVSKGVITNPQTSVVSSDSLATREELSQAKALWAPSVDFRGESGWERTDTRTIDSESQFRNRGSLTLTQLLFDGMGTNNEIARQKHRVESTSNRVAETAEFVGLDVTEAYIEVLRQRDLVAIAKANVDDHLRILDSIRTASSAGTVTEGDVQQALARLAQARATLSSSEELLRNAESLFIQKVGEMPGQMAFPEVPRDKIQANATDAVRAALTQSPTLAIFEADIDVAEAEYRGSDSTMYPKLELQANATRGRNLSGIDGKNNSESVQGVMTWNLYRGGADMARKREFMYRHAVAKDRRADVARGVEKSMRDTWSGMMSARERAQQFLDQANANEKVVGIYLDQFGLNRRSLLDVLDSQNELFVSRSSHVNALYTEIFAVYRVLALQGRLLDTLGVAKPREASVDMTAAKK
jgi:adhesin transport system outer membrane protein